MTQRLIPIGLLSLICTACEPIEIHVTLEDAAAPSPDTAESPNSEVSSPEEPSAHEEPNSWEPVAVPENELNCSDLPAYEGSLAISSQEDLDALTDEYGSINDLTLEGPDISSLEQLRCFSEIEHLIIDGVSASYLSLDEMDNLGSLEVHNSQLQRINIPNLEQTHRLWIFDNPHLQSIHLPNTIETTGRIRIYDNPSLNNLNLYSLHETIELRLRDNSSLTEISLPWLQRVSGHTEFSGNDALERINLCRCLRPLEAVSPSLKAHCSQRWICFHWSMLVTPSQAICQAQDSSSQKLD